jgi:hypothetical protein
MIRAKKFDPEFLKKTREEYKKWKI